MRAEGLRWTNPFFSKERISLRVRNFESGKLKVNDSDGNPIEIAAAVVVWQVLDTAEAVFCVDNYENYAHIQTASALRQMAQSYPYDSHDDSRPSLRSHGKMINTHLRDEIQTRLGKAGVEVVEARIRHRKNLVFDRLMFDWRPKPTDYPSIHDLAQSDTWRLYESIRDVRKTYCDG